jgi:quinol monooxygenase YgiN
MITLISKWKLIKGCPPELLTALRELVAKSKSEPGNLIYLAKFPAPDPLNANGEPLSPPPPPISLKDQKEVVFIESYENLEALNQHLQGEAFSSFLASNIQYFCQKPNGYPQTETEFLSSINPTL